MIMKSIVVGAVGIVASAAPALSASLNDVNHIIVIYMENRSFDNLYGCFPGAEGIANAGATATQVDKDGKAYATLPPASTPPRSRPPMRASRPTCRISRSTSTNTCALDQ